MSEKLYIEYCIDCDTHRWCTRHNEEQYLDMFNRATDAIMSENPNIEVFSNQIPIGFQDKFFMSGDEAFKSVSRVRFPRVGAFEIYFDRKEIWSKLKSGQWPNCAGIAAKVKEMLESNKLPPIAPVAP